MRDGPIRTQGKGVFGIGNDDIGGNVAPTQRIDGRVQMRFGSLRRIIVVNGGIKS